MLNKLSEKDWQKLAMLALGVIAVLILFTFQDYGISWDEEYQSQYGQAVFDYYASGLMDHRYDEIFNLYLYGGMFDGLAALIDAYTPIGLYESRHLLNAGFGLLGLWGTWRAGRLLGGGMAGFAALVLLALTPMYYGHMFNNPKDIPFACGVVWSIYYMAKSLAAFPRPSWQLMLKLGVIFGLTLGIRVGGVMLLGYWGMALMLLAATMAYKQPQSWPKLLGSLFRLGVPVTILAYIVMLVCWPWAQESPFLNPYHALVEFSHFPQDVEVLLKGTTYSSMELPWFYVPLYFLMQLPVPLLALGSTGLAALPFILKTLPSRGMQMALAMIVLTIFVPIAFAVFGHPALYDAVRHFIFVLPLLCVLAALALCWLFKVYSALLPKIGSLKVQRGVSIVLGIAAMAVVALHLHVMAQLHPYEYIYANSLVGGVRGAYGKYEMDYWGSSFKDAASALQDFVAKQGGVPPGRIYKIAICGPWSSAMIYLPPDYEPVEADDTADFFLATTRWMCQTMRAGKNIIRIDRLGVPLSIIKDLRGGYESIPGVKKHED